MRCSWGTWRRAPGLNQRSRSAWKPVTARRRGTARRRLAMGLALALGAVACLAALVHPISTGTAPQVAAGSAASVAMLTGGWGSGPGPANTTADSPAVLAAALAAAEPPAHTVPPLWWSPALQAAADLTGLPVTLLGAVAQAESEGNPHAISPAGALGLMQLMPATAAALGVRNVFDAAANALGGARYLYAQLAAHDGGQRGCVPDPAACPTALELALAAYNAGPGAVARYGGVPPYAQTRRYVQEVMGLYARYRAQWA